MYMCVYLRSNGVLAAEAARLRKKGPTTLMRVDGGQNLLWRLFIFYVGTIVVLLLLLLLLLAIFFPNTLKRPDQCRL